MEKYQYDKKELELLEGSPVPFSIYQFIDEKVVLIAVSKGMLDTFGFPDSEDCYEQMENNLYQYTHPDDVARIFEAGIKFATEGGNYHVIFRVKVRDEYRIIDAHGRHFNSKTGERLAIVWYSDEGAYQDDGKMEGESFEVQLRSAIRESSMFRTVNYDFLTGLPSMTYFFELADATRREHLEKGIVTAVLFTDLSGMQGYNQKYGFSEGDALIRAVSRVLVKYFGNENCSRFGGDHFVVYTEAKDIEERAQAFIDDCKDINDGKNLPVRIGIYKDKNNVIGISTACDRAKMACNKQRSSYVSHITYFDEEMLHREERKQYFIENLDRAIKNDYIKVYYQPIVRAANGCVSDEEGLARWDDEDEGFFEPGDFIPILEEAKLVYKLDLYIAEKILKKMKDQADSGLYVVPQSVNLSRSDFDSCDIVEEIKKRVDEAGIDRSKLTIEITEGIIGDDIDYIKTQIERFQRHGFKVWMDDYGSGYSSPDILQKIPFDTIKLDMQFMRQFYNGEKSKIIITEIVKMAVSLGIETVAEGVETEEQAEFLKEVGCTKLQGFYYNKPVPLAEIIERYRKGIQIGFENPAESEYYESIGRINLYDFTMAAEEDEDDSLENYFNTMPMLIVEGSEDKLSLIRCNRPYREFSKRNLFHLKDQVKIDYNTIETGPGVGFVKAIKQCAIDGRRVILDERTDDGAVIHFLIRRIAINPVTGVVAFAIVILGVVDDAITNTGLTYAYIAEALSADYMNLFYVNLDTDNFIEYSPSGAYGDLALEQHGEDFFGRCYRNAETGLHEEDLELFRAAFTKENIEKALNERGHFTLTYRIIKDGKPIYVSMKVVRIKSKGNHIIIGINNIDAQIKRQEAMERVKEERITYARIAALSGDYIFIYTVNPETDSYMEYSSKPGFEGLGLAKVGDFYFDNIRRVSKHAVYLEDLDKFLEEFTKENIIAKIKKDGIFIINFRMMIEGEPVFVCLKAAFVQEKDGEQLIVGVSNIDAQVKRDEEYARKLSMARSEANTDVLTGVKNKHAYVDMEAQMDKLIEEGTIPKFAIVVLDLNDLKIVNDTQGHKAGDEYLRKGCVLICDIFRHSPVFRVGGDEFAVVAQGNDYRNITKLMRLLQERNLLNHAMGDVVVAGGMARYEGDVSVAAVFDRADTAMYENKTMLKNL